jgi:TnpA family transposase
MNALAWVVFLGKHGELRKHALQDQLQRVFSNITYYLVYKTLNQSVEQLQANLVSTIGKWLY